MPSSSVSESPEFQPTNSSGSVRVPAIFFGATILLSAFLLFQVQPLIAKLILPWFGGSAAVWTTCMLFFQLALLAGYAYAHWLNSRKGMLQTWIHLGLLAVSLATLPILPSTWWKPSGAEDPLLRILGLLTATVGLPYFLLSSTSPLLQSWYSRSRGGAMPYRFFALSNAGSMLGLLLYPVLVEPNLTAGQQAWMWSIAYASFVVVCATVALRSRHGVVAAESQQVEAGPAPTISDRLIWMGLAACASALLLAVTNHLTQNVAAIPFLWVLPLSLYLLSFILCFDSDRWYRRWAFTRMGAGALPALAYAISDQGNISDLKLAVSVYCMLLFVLFMVCHGELAVRRPSSSHLTGFYLMVSVGGAIGGLLIGYAAPYLFNALYDLPVVISLTGLLFLYLLYRERNSEMPDWKFLFGFSTAIAFGIIGFLARDTWNSYGDARLLVRNFYGALRVSDHSTDGKKGPARRLTHGTIDHGEQFLWPQFSRIATTYYSEKSGVGIAIHAIQMSGPLHIGVIGLGAGTLTTYVRPIDKIRLYDINPLVVDIANTQFSFLKNCMGPKTIVLGDARLQMEKEPTQNFDLLAVDAFSGDAIPVHLLTHEAFQLYWRHLKPDGVLAVHVSNKYLGLGPVVKQLAELDQRQATLVANTESDEDEVSTSDWVLVTTRPGFHDLPDVKAGAEKVVVKPGLRPWTDTYSNLYQILLK